MIVASIAIQSPSPQGEASVPMVTFVPLRLYASMAKNRSTEVQCPMKKARSHSSSVSICRAHMHPGLSSGLGPPQAAHSGSINGLITMRRPETLLSLPSSEWRSFFGMTFKCRKRSKSAIISSIIYCLTFARMPPISMVTVMPIQVTTWPSCPFLNASLKPRAFQTRISNATSSRRRSGVPRMAASGSST